MDKRIIITLYILVFVSTLIFYTGDLFPTSADNDLPLADGTLSSSLASAGLALYPGDCLPRDPDAVKPDFPGNAIGMYPGETIQLYPGDEWWDGRFESMYAPPFTPKDSLWALAAGPDDSIYVGGDFTQAGGVNANYIARFDGQTWHSLNNGVDAEVSTITVSGADVYAAGSFTHAGGLSANHIARFDGTTWHALSSGLDGYANSIAVLGNKVYVGGSFTRAGGLPVNNIAFWDGTAWHSLGSGVNGTINSLVTNGSDLYAGGSFTSAGGVISQFIARWDGTNWHALGTGPSGPVNSIAVGNGTIYASGLAFVDQWDGAGWHPIASISGLIREITFGPYGLYITGVLPDLYGVGRWDGTNLSSLGYGLTSRSGSNYNYLIAGSARRTAFAGDNLFVIGDFTYAGYRYSPNFAIWHTTPVVHVEPFAQAPGGAFAAYGCYFTADSPLAVSINGDPDLAPLPTGGLKTNAFGELQVDLQTSPKAKPDNFTIQFTTGGPLNPRSGSAGFQIDSAGTVRPPVAGLPIIHIPAPENHNSTVYLPITIK